MVSTILQKGIKKFLLELQKRALCLQKKSVNAGVEVALVRYATIGGTTQPDLPGTPDRSLSMPYMQTN